MAEIRLVALLGVAVLALAACTTTTSSASTPAADCTPQTAGLTTFTAGTLTVGVPENPPYTKLNGTEASGMEIDIIAKLAAAECLAVAYTPITYANGIAMINNQKRTDIITGGWYVTAERAEQVGFTTPTYYDQMAIISKSGVDTVAGLETIGTVGSGTGFSWQDDMTEVLGDRLKTYPSTAEMKQDLVAGRIQAALDGYGVATEAYKGTDFTVKQAQADTRVAITTEKPISAFPIDKDNRALSDAFSALIDGYRADGTLAKIAAEYDLAADLVVPADVAATSTR
ncbi:transporter substrate-binding domain-containing protein [Actinoplanes sp. NPDC051851]|uniref:substrate-binding periplasmic protein n=1 Tax=Actinoplanes sp. NPDC051851 TaxID=3154753 RepID=UPI003435CDEC